MVIGVPGSLVGVASAHPGRHNLMEISGTSPYPMDAFRLVTNGIDRARAPAPRGLHRPKRPGHDDRPIPPPRTPSQNQVTGGHCPAAARSVCTPPYPPEPALISAAAPVETLVSSTTLESSCTTSR